jgi:glycosyltransferase involved in cell wall biosynthesis
VGENHLAHKLNLAGKFVVSYFGTHGMAHHLETALYAAGELREYPDIVFLLVGDGAERKRLLALRDELCLSNVIMLEQQPKSNMPYLWQLSDVSLVLLKKSELFKTVIPSKIFESMAMKIPILLGVQGESQEIIEAAQSGYCIEPENHRQLAEYVERLYKDRDTCKTLGDKGQKFVEKFYDRNVLADRYEYLLSTVCNIDVKNGHTSIDR